MRQKSPKRILNKDVKKQKNPKGHKSKDSDNNSSGGLYYSFMTVILLLCLVQITISAVLNVSKVVSYHSKIKQITNTRDAALSLNAQLKDNIKNFSNVTGLEAIARNNLKMSSEDEVMVIINEPKVEEDKNKRKKFGIF